MAVLLVALVGTGCGTSAPGVAQANSPAPVASTSAAPAATPSPTPTVSPAVSAGPAGGTTPQLGSVTNFRDVAAEGLALPDGRRMATGVVYRSAALKAITGADRARLRSAGVTLVIDLRTPTEVSADPDRLPAGVTYRRVNIYGTSRTPALTRQTVDAARARMRRLNVDFVADPGERARIATVLELVATTDGRVLVHCSAGKDRTGWISAVLQLVAGADRDDVVAEYLKSNDYRAELIAEHYRSTLAAKGLDAARVRRASDHVEAQYLQAGLDELDRRYGGTDGYLTEGLGLSRETIEALRARLVR